MNQKTVELKGVSVWTVYNDCSARAQIQPLKYSLIIVQSGQFSKSTLQNGKSRVISKIRFVLWPNIYTQSQMNPEILTHCTIDFLCLIYDLI